MTDRWGVRDATPATRTWTVAIPPAPPPARTATATACPTRRDNCPDATNADQADGDGDKVGDACESSPPPTTPVAGQTTNVTLIRGEVFVKLPGRGCPPGRARSAGRARRSRRRRVRAARRASPRSRWARSSTPAAASSRSRRRSTAARCGAPSRYRAGIFQIRQRRALARNRSKRRALEARVVSPSGAERTCHSKSPGKGKVRSLVTTAKGVFRTVGGAATAAPAKGRTATFTITDRCDGTRVKVASGRVAVTARKKGAKPRTVKAGKSFLVKARLFRVKKGRQS